METHDEITKKHMLTVKKMGILEDEIDLTKAELKEISTELGMTEEGWNYCMQLADKKLVLAESHLRKKSYRESMVAAEESQLLNPYIRGARGLKAKAFLLIAINEDDDSFLEKAKKQAKITLEKESNDKNALEVMATLSSKDRIIRKNDEGKSSKKVIILIAIVVLMVAGGLLFALSGDSEAFVESNQTIIKVEKQLESAFDKQSALIPKVEALLTESKKDEASRSALESLKKKLKDDDLSLKDRYDIHEELSGELSAVVYRKSTEKESKLLEDLRVLLEGAENRIKTEKKNYNDAIGNYNTTVNGSSKKQKESL